VALKTHGIFTVGLVRIHESRAQYHRIVADMVETLQPVGRLEEILGEKLAMLVWRYRRLLQAEAAEIAREAESAEEGGMESKVRTAALFAKDMGLIGSALATDNEVGLELALDSLKKLRQLISEKGLDWERDREALRTLYGPVKEQGEKGHVTIRVIDPEKGIKGDKGPDPDGPMASKYCELALMGKGQDGSSSLAADAAKSMVNMRTEKIEVYESMFWDWSRRSDDRNRIKAAAALVPKQEVTDRLQRYEGNLERSFDRTLSQLECLQRLRLGQPVPPALKVDVSH
jgi:hypothetical protein